MSNPIELLRLNDGWSQIPPKKNGEYWFASAKSWHSENAYDQNLLEIIKIKGGKRVSVMDSHSLVWVPPDFESTGNPIWDTKSQFEMMAAWRKKQPGEDFNNLPPEITEIIYERLPSKCAACKKLAATYRVWKEVAGRTIYLYPRVCYSCKGIQMRDDYYK